MRSACVGIVSDRLALVLALTFRSCRSAVRHFSTGLAYDFGAQLMLRALRRDVRRERVARGGATAIAPANRRCANSRSACRAGKRAESRSSPSLTSPITLRTGTSGATRLRTVASNRRRLRRPRVRAECDALRAGAGSNRFRRSRWTCRGVSTSSQPQSPRSLRRAIGAVARGRSRTGGVVRQLGVLAIAGERAHGRRSCRAPWLVPRSMHLGRCSSTGTSAEPTTQTAAQSRFGQRVRRGRELRRARRRSARVNLDVSSDYEHLMRDDTDRRDVVGAPRRRRRGSSGGDAAASCRTMPT